MNAETWAKILYTYGPFALLVFSVFVIERRVRSAWRTSNQDRKKEQTAFIALYCLTWCLIFGVAIYSVYAWKRINLDRRPQIVGTLESMPNTRLWGQLLATSIFTRIQREVATQTMTCCLLIRTSVGMMGRR